MVPTVFEAISRAVKSGFLNLSIGVGTVIINILQFAKSFLLYVYNIF